ncbi:MAG: hypothetical protein RMY29_021370 [Nostoc sp. CreGUA01]|nr:hypothetical protein [Nostoc sp. CreGUA01]
MIFKYSCTNKWALGIGHWALVILPHLPISPSPHLPTHRAP